MTSCSIDVCDSSHNLVFVRWAIILLMCINMIGGVPVTWILLLWGLVACERVVSTRAHVHIGCIPVVDANVVQQHSDMWYMIIVAI